MIELSNGFEAYLDVIHMDYIEAGQIYHQSLPERCQEMVRQACVDEELLR